MKNLKKKINLLLKEKENILKKLDENNNLEEGRFVLLKKITEIDNLLNKYYTIVNNNKTGKC